MLVVSEASLGLVFAGAPKSRRRIAVATLAVASCPITGIIWATTRLWSGREGSEHG
jgi:hypothetical protein